jgi:signal transduction histidine kinase
MKIGFGWPAGPLRLDRSVEGPPAEEGTPATRRRAQLVAAALILLSVSLTFLMQYRYPIVPYLAVSVVVASFWRFRTGVLCLTASVGVLTLTALSEPRSSWPDGLREPLAFALLGVVFVGTRGVLEELERHRRREQQLIVELSEAVEQLRQSHRDLEAANEQLLRSERLAALGQFSATIAHELRNPLNVIKLAAHYVRTHVPDPDERLQRNLSHLNQYVDRAGDIINDLLTFSRLPAPVLGRRDVNEIVHAVVRALPVLERVTVDLSLAPELPPVMADARQIEQAVGNLAQNALQAMPEGGRLTLGTRRVRDQVEITVRDTGPGVPEELRARIFEPFYSTKASGTGLGLPLVREITAAHGGQCSLESAPGEGSCFVLSLPLVTGVLPAELTGMDRIDRMQSCEANS